MSQPIFTYADRYWILRDDHPATNDNVCVCREVHRLPSGEWYASLTAVLGRDQLTPTGEEYGGRVRWTRDADGCWNYSVGKVHVWLQPRPPYCDRGHWVGNVEGIASI